MNKKPVQVAVIICLLFVIMCEVGFIASRHMARLPEAETFELENAVGEILASGKMVKINNERIPSYSIEGMDEIYFTDYDLELKGFECSLSNGVYSLRAKNKKEGNSTEKFIGDIVGTKAFADKNKIRAGLKLIDIYKNDRVLLVPSQVLDSLCQKIASEELKTIYYASGLGEEVKKIMEETQKEIDGLTGKPTSADADKEKKELSVDGKKTTSSSKIIVIDPGHGKSSSLMSEDEKKTSGWTMNQNGAWGEWRHYKTGSSTDDCQASGCNGRVTPNGACWYPIGNSDRATEPELNLDNALAAKKYLEAMGYTVRMTRTTNDENPSITRRISYCYPGNDTSKTADASAFICIHSNAGGGSGSAYIPADGAYDQRGISTSYVEESNRLGELCNESIVNSTSLKKSGNGTIGGMSALIALCKSPVPCGYLEVGFFDNSAELEIIKNESDKIGKAIAEGIDKFMKEKN